MKTIGLYSNTVLFPFTLYDVITGIAVILIQANYICIIRVTLVNHALFITKISWLHIIHY